MDIIGIPLWGQLSILGLSLGMNVFVAVEFVRGTWTTRKNVEQIQKVADTFKDAWEVSEKKWEAMGPTVNNLVVTSETMLNILQKNAQHVERIENP